tara:strand:- start:362 stop:676 length:315 start_codon:yes stop_codon:yes gene_type:complete
MAKRYKNERHLAWVRERSCSLAHNRDCLGSVEAHHLLRPWKGFRGMGRKASDENALPLCQRHHIMLHKRGDEDAFFLEHCESSDYGRDKARQLWLISPFYRSEE